MIADAGRDTDDPELSQWARRISDSIHDSELVRYFPDTIAGSPLEEPPSAAKPAEAPREPGIVILGPAASGKTTFLAAFSIADDLGQIVRRDGLHRADVLHRDMHVFRPHRYQAGPVDELGVGAGESFPGELGSGQNVPVIVLPARRPAFGDRPEKSSMAHPLGSLALRKPAFVIRA